MDLTPTFILENVTSLLLADFLKALLIIGISVLLFVAFAVTVFVGAYALAFLWAGYENQFRKGDDDEFGFNEETVFIVLVQHWTAFLLAVDELLNLAVAAISSAVDAIVSNWVGIVVFILAFAFYIIWDSWHNILIPSFAQTYTCYISALVRTLILPVIDLTGFVIQSALPVTNAARQVINAVTIFTILRSIVCGIEILQQIILLLSLAFTQFLFAIVMWARTANTPTNAILDVGPDFIPATRTLGQAIASFDKVFVCACEPIGPIVVEPLFQPFRDSAFQNATNATLALPFVFLSQGIARPIVRSVQNFQRQKGLPFAQTIDRPSFNSSFDTATRVLNQTGAVFTGFTYAVLNVTINLGEAAISACPSQRGWQRTGNCNNTSPAALGFCNGPRCSVFAVRTNASVNASYVNSIIDFSCNRSTGCFAGAPPTTRCTCLDCFCTYAYINPFTGNATNLLAVGNCSATRNASSCEIEVPTVATVAAPTYDFWGGILGLIDAMFIQPFRYFFNILFQIDVVFTSLDGYLLFFYDYGIERFNWAITAFFGDINWLGRFFIALGEKAAANANTTMLEQSPALRPMMFDSRKISPLSKEAVGLFSFARLQKAKMAEGDAIQIAYNFIAELFFFLGDITLAFFVFLERLIFNEQYYMFFGTIYFTVRSGVEARPRLRIDPFAYAKFRWGDNATSGIQYECGYIGNVGVGNPGQFTSVFAERVINATAITCTEQEELLDFCRFVFQRVEAKNVTSTNLTDIGLAVVPKFIQITAGANGPYSDAAVQTCLQRVTNCVPSLQFSAIQQVEILNVVNDYNVTLQKGVDIFRAIDPLIGVFCPNCTVIQNLISGFIEPLVPIILVLIDPIVHTEKLFTTTYLRCLDIEGALRAFNSFTINFTNIFRLINEKVTGTPCLTGNNARDSRILCVLPQGIDSFVDVLVQLGIQAWRFAQLLLSVVAGTVPPQTVANSITFEPVFDDVENLVFAGFSVLAQAIPRTFNCTQITPSLGNGCCFNEPITGVFNCRDNATIFEGCLSPNATGFGPGSSFRPAQQCSVAFPTQCQPKTVQAVVATELASFVADFINVWFRIVLGVIKTVVDTLAGLDIGILNIFGNVIAAVLRPLFKVVSDAFFSFANVFECLGAADIAATFRQIGDVFVVITTISIAFLVTAVQFFIFLIAGFVQLLFTGQTTLLKSAINILAQFFILFLIAVFGENFICGLQDAVCLLSFGTLNFAINACRALNPPYTFTFCQTFGSARPNGLQCVGDDITCVTGCPDFPLGCCGALPFPPDGTATQNLTNSDSRYSCRPKMNQNALFQRCFAGTTPLADLKLCYGQPSPDTNCRLFQNNTECQNIVYIDPVTGAIVPARKRSVESSMYGYSPKHHEHNDEWTPSDSFCGSFLAAYGFERARHESTLNKPLHNDDKSGDYKVASRCYQLAKTQSAPIEEQVHEALLNILRSYMTPMLEKGREIQASTVSHWKSLAREAEEHANHYHQTGEHHPTKRSLDARLEHYHAREQTRELEPLEIRNGRLLFDHGAEIQRQIVVSIMSAAFTFNRAMQNDEFTRVTNKFKAAAKARDEVTKFSTQHKTMQQLFADDVNLPLTEWDKRYIGLSILIYRAREYGYKLTDGLREYFGDFADLIGMYDETTEKFVRNAPIDRGAMQRRVDESLRKFRATRLVNTYRLRFAEGNAETVDEFRSAKRVSLLATTFASQPISNDTLAGLGLFECDPATAVLCTNCYILDAGVNSIALAGRGVIDYFQNNVTGFGRQAAVFQKQINTTLFDPIGTDVYTTVNKTTPFIGARFFNIYWPWKWNYTEFKAILASGNSSSNVDELLNLTEIVQETRAVRVGRIDEDNNIYDLFKVVLTPIVNALERVVDAIRDSTTLAVLQALYARYIACDYQGALVCSSTLGIGLFDATIITIVAYLVLMAIATVVVPGTQVVLGRFLNIIFIYVLLWMAYGASPLCTLASIFGGIRGVPACLPVETAQLINEVFPQCPYLPPSLIDPRDLAEASVTLCAECGTAPRMLDCATAVGFLNGLDVFFYLSALNLSPAVNQQIADATTTLLPDISVVARLYTPEYAASLGAAGMECAGILFFSMFIAATTLAFRAARVIVFAAGVTFFIFGVILATIAAIFAANFLLRQMEEGFVHGVLVRKLRVRPWSSSRKTELEILEKMD